MSILQQLADAQVHPEIPLNENLETLEHAAVYGKNHPLTSGLTWGYCGGHWGDYDITPGFVTLTANSTNYLVVPRATGVFSTSTSDTNWLDTANYARVYKVPTGASSVTLADVEDHRQATAGIFTSGVVAGGGTAGTLDADTDGTLAANSDAKIATQKATKTYVDAKVAGLSWKQAVRAASTTSGTLATAFENGDTLDGVALATGDRILLKNQSAASENGIYVVNASGAPTRATDADTGAELVDASVWVSEGTTLADTQWVCTSNAPITLGSTSLAFAQLQSNTTYPFAATARIFARKTAGAGTGEEATLSEILDFIGSAAQGDILYRGASAWARLPAGTTGYLLKTGGASADPAWAGGVIALTDGATISVNASLGDSFRVVLGGNRTLANPTNLVNGQVLNFRILQDGTGTRTLAYGSKFKFAGGTPPVLSTAASSKDFMSCQYDAADDTLNCVMQKAFA